ncbi:MAG: hypothetical protein ED557_13005 [Balneola sp.]|nr:MAG: hypothetical protein ED557_13005 [Balneola sp.]
MALAGLVSAIAQPVLTPRNVALGGGGSSYLTDYSANFYNPANLLIQDRRRNIDVGLFITGTYFNAVQNFSDLEQQSGNLTDYLSAFEPGRYTISDADRLEILEDNYIRDRNTSLHQTRLDLILLGFKWRNEDRAFSLALRNRISSSFEVGRGWYSNVLQDIGGVQSLDRSLTHRYQSLYEISLGYSESFNFFSDMTPRLDEFYFGIAPKLVLGGAYQNAKWDNVYSTSGGINQLTQEFEYQASGNFGIATDQYLNGVAAETALTQNISDEIFNRYGIGIGLDIGFTYLITLGNDLSTISNNNQQTNKSLRLSLSITDIGFVNYSENGIDLNITSDTTNVASLPTGVASDAFVGAPGQFIDFIDKYGAQNPFVLAQQERGDFSVLLPTALHAGALLEINRIKLMGDLSIGFTNNAFNSTKLVASAGIEIRPLKFLPIRAGTQLATELPNYFSFGTAIETQLWDLSIATQFVSRTFGDNPTITGLTVAALQFHF